MKTRVLRIKSLLAIFLCLPMFGCSSIYFFPSREYVATPDQLGMKYQEVEIPVGKDSGPNGIKLQSWWLPSSAPSVCGTIVVLHGNAQNMSNHLFGVSWLSAEGFNLFIYDYRGYGRSGGFPVVPSVIEDNETVLSTLFSRLDGGQLAGAAGKSPPEKVVIYGQSLGGALAVPTVVRSKFRDRFAAVILESVFSSYPSIIREKLGQFYLTWPFQYPLSWLYYSRNSPIKLIERISPIPLLIVHGLNDEIVFPDNSRHLFDQAAEPKELWTMESAGHINSFQSPHNREKLIQYLRKSFGCNRSVLPTIQ